MAEKGGKGFSVPRASKSALKSPASVKGKNDNSGKSKRGRQVQFDSEDSLGGSTVKSNAKVATTAVKGDGGKGGLGGKATDGGKSSVARAPAPLELKIEHELPENTKCLMDCEAAEILQGIQEQMVLLSRDPAIKIPVSFDRGLAYANRGSPYTSAKTVRQVLEPLRKHGVSEGEICTIANTQAETVDEVFSLLPSLKGKKNKLKDPLKNTLDELAKVKKPST